MLTIVMKRGNVITYKGDSFTDYDWKEHAFIVMKDNQWVGIFNWDCVEEVLYTDPEEC